MSNNTESRGQFNFDDQNLQCGPMGSSTDILVKNGKSSTGVNVRFSDSTIGSFFLDAGQSKRAKNSAGKSNIIATISKVGTGSTDGACFTDQ